MKMNDQWLDWMNEVIPINKNYMISFRVANFGRFRMLKEADTGKILKTRSEVTILNELINFMKAVRDDSGSDAVIMVSHETEKRVLVQLLLDSLKR